MRPHRIAAVKKDQIRTGENVVKSEPLYTF